MVNVHDICLDADLFRAAYPHWPSPEPEPVGVVTGQGEESCPAERETASGWLYCNRESSHSQVKHLDGRTGKEWSDAAPETLGPADGAPLFAAMDETELPCLDCGAKPGRSCYPDCLRYAEGV